MSQPCGALVSYFHIFAGISFLNAMVRTLLLVALLLAPCQPSSHYSSMEECSILHFMLQDPCMVLLGVNVKLRFQVLVLPGHQVQFSLEVLQQLPLTISQGIVLSTYKYIPLNTLEMLDIQYTKSAMIASGALGYQHI